MQCPLAPCTNPRMKLQPVYQFTLLLKPMTPVSMKSELTFTISYYCRRRPIQSKSCQATSKIKLLALIVSCKLQLQNVFERARISFYLGLKPRTRSFCFFLFIALFFCFFECASVLFFIAFKRASLFFCFCSFNFATRFCSCFFNFVHEECEVQTSY